MSEKEEGPIVPRRHSRESGNPVETKTSDLFLIFFGGAGILPIAANFPGVAAVSSPPLKAKTFASLMICARWGHRAYSCKVRKTLVSYQKSAAIHVSSAIFINKAGVPAHLKRKMFLFPFFRQTRCLPHQNWFLPMSDWIPAFAGMTAACGQREN